MNSPAIVTVLASHDWPTRAAAKLVVTDSLCWEWTGYRNANGYGQMRVGSMTDGTRRNALVHRLVYELLVGAIPSGVEPDHLCRNRACANPGHLELVTHRVNMLRGSTVAARSAAATHCPKGHPYSGDNLAITCRGRRQCRKCRSEINRRQYERRIKV